MNVKRRARRRPFEPSPDGTGKQATAAVLATVALILSLAIPTSASAAESGTTPEESAAPATEQGGSEQGTIDDDVSAELPTVVASPTPTPTPSTPADSDPRPEGEQQPKVQDDGEQQPKAPDEGEQQSKAPDEGEQQPKVQDDGERDADGEQPSGTAVENDDNEIDTQVVPVPQNSEAVITVSVGGDRTGTSTIGPLARVTLQLYDGGQAGPGAAVAEPWATCVSDGDGDCSFTVPDTQPEITERGECLTWFIVCLEYEQIVVQERGDNYDRQFWVVATGAPTGWYLNGQLQTGSGDSAYAFRTPGVEAGRTYESGDEFMAGGLNGRDSSGVWQLARTNPSLPYTCDAGLSAALILDLSGSVADAGAVDDLQDAAKSMVGALHGTGSSIALYTFAADAPRNGGSSGRNYASMAIDDGNNLDTIEDRIDAYSAGGGTNWDEGIYQVAADHAGYDLAIVITDGQPTFYNDGGNGSSTRFAEVEHAIFSANALKSQGTRMLAVGVGDGTSGSATNLSAVSGQTPYTAGTSAIEADYFQSDWNELASLLEEVARGATCQATIEVVKQTIAYGENGASNGGSGWTFEVDTDLGELTPSAVQTTDASGSASWTLGFDTPDPTAVVSIDETLSDAQTDEGWALDDASCRVNGGDPVAPTNLSVASGDSITCTFLNTQQLVPGIEVVKRAWAASSAAELPGAEEVPAGSELVSGTVVTWTYEVTNTGQTTLSGIEVTDDRVGAAACPTDTLEPGDVMTCTATAPVTALP